MRQILPPVDLLISCIVVVDESFDSAPFFAEDTEASPGFPMNIEL